MRSIIIFSLLSLTALLLGLPAQGGGPYYYNYVPTYYAPSYAIDYYNGNYYYHDAGYFQGQYYPAGWYAWISGAWYLRNYGYLYPTATTTAPSYTPGWQGKLLDIAANRDKVEGRLRTAALDHQAYLAAVDKLGLTGNFRWESYGLAPLYPGGYGAAGYHATNANLGSFGVNGNTVYGYSLSSLKDVYGDNYLPGLFQQASRLAEGSQQLAGQATSDFSGLVGQEGNNRARVATIIAEAEAAKIKLDAAKPQSSTHEETKVQVTGSQPGPLPQAPGVPVIPPATDGPQGIKPPPVAKPREAQQDVFYTTILPGYCAACHGDKDPRGGFKVSSYAGMSLKEKSERVWPLLTTRDKEKRMPKGNEPLPPEIVRQFVTH